MTESQNQSDYMQTYLSLKQNHLFGQKLVGADDSYLTKHGYDENFLTSEEKYNVYQEQLQLHNSIIKQIEKDKQEMIQLWNMLYVRATPSCDSH